jgi:hypothetical protein
MLNGREGPLLLRIVLIAGAAVAAVLVYAAIGPNTLRITRSAVIKAYPETVFTLIDDFHNWVQWACLDHGGD